MRSMVGLSWALCGADQKTGNRQLLSLVGSYGEINPGNLRGMIIVTIWGISLVVESRVVCGT